MAEAQAAPKGNKKLIVIIAAVVAVLLLATAGGAAFLLTRSSDHGDDGSVETHEAGKKKKAEKDADHPPIFEKLQQFTVNLNSPDEDAMLQTDIVVEMADAKSQERIKAQMPKIQSEVNQLLRSKSPQEVRTVGSMAKLGAEIRKLINHALGAEGDEEGVLSVNFTTFIVQ
ncbi:flagellar basal body-associated FliL family protein [Jeongeupia wiesaeckerbachi]|uniref:flagellar basal body-associated FliL family protein n=1 Tax=Jeongeupia wiesaeckerbachi TaxID=3051218 RepID=UPI003D807F28